MLPFIVAGIIFVFLLLGAIVFLVCLPIPQTRQYALSAALWCAMWGPCFVGLMLVAGTGVVMATFVMKTVGAPTLHSPILVSSFGWGLLVFGVFMAAIVSTGAAWVHQVVVKRLTLALFRLYAAAVCSGIGSVFGWCLGLWLLTRTCALWVGLLWAMWAIAMLLLIFAFGMMGYKNARVLRGSAPKSFTWISEEEFAGS